MISEITQIETDLPYFGLLVTAILVFVVFWVLSAVLSRLVFPCLIKHISEEKHPIPVMLIRGFSRPLTTFLKLAGICIALLILCNYDASSLSPSLARMIEKAPAVLYTLFRMLAVFASRGGWSPPATSPASCCATPAPASTCTSPPASRGSWPPSTRCWSSRSRLLSCWAR